MGIEVGDVIEEGKVRVLFVIASGLLLGCITWMLLRFVREVLWRPYALQRILTSQGVKGPKYRPLFGNVPQIMALLEEAKSKAMEEISHDIIPRVLPHYHHWAKLYGKPFLFWFGWKPRLFVTNPEQIKEVLSNKFGHFQKIPARPEARHLIGNGLLTKHGEAWAQRRRIINPSFHIESLKGMIPTMADCTRDMLSRWKNLVDSGQNEVEVNVEFRALTADVISRTAFGSSYEEGKRVFELQWKQASFAAKSFGTPNFPGLKFLPTPNNMYKWGLNKEIKKALSRLIERREQEAALSGANDGFGKDLLGLMMSANRNELQGNSKGLAMSLDDIIDECKTFYFAGHETTSTLLTWTMFLLGHHPEWQEKARDEVFHAYGRSCTPNSISVNNLKLMGMILNESLRLYPPIIAIFRETYKSMKLGDVVLPKGVELVLTFLAVQHDKSLWGDDVFEFKPERFMDGMARASKLPSAFTPFSTGPRVCIGQNFAMLEAKTALAMILQRFSFVISPSYRHAPTTVITLQPQFGLQVLLQPLSN